jgi:hypothetical protein
MGPDDSSSSCGSSEWKLDLLSPFHPSRVAPQARYTTLLKLQLQFHRGASSRGSTEKVWDGPIGVKVVPTSFPIAAR